MLGGALWCLGNAFTISIIKTIGLATGLLIWGGVNLIMGWASGRFGLFGLTPDVIANPTLNSIGILFAVASLGVYIFLKPDLNAGKDGAKKLVDETDDAEGAYAGLLYNQSELYGAKAGGGVNDAGAEGAVAAPAEGEEVSWTDKLSPSQQKMFGIGASCVSGILYGVNFDPPSYVVDHASDYPGASTQLADYIFPHFCGIFITSVAILQIYAMATRNAPRVYPEIVFPGFISGLMWAAAQVCWFIANARLDLSVAFPLISIGPGLVGALWGVFVFHELTGKKNYILLVVAFSLTFASAACTVLSKN
jgi:hypothetical protein